MESSAAAPFARISSFPLSELIAPLGAWLLGFLLVGLLAGNDGGFFPTAWAWTAFTTWLLAASVVAARPRLELGAVNAGRSIADVMRSPGEDGPPALGPGWPHTPTNAGIFYGGYFCARGADGRRVRLVLALRELDTLTDGSSRVTGPFSAKARTRGAC